jgi:hypothetical protein
MAAMIIGIVFVGVLMSMSVSTEANIAASDLTTAITLAQHIREMTMSTPFVDPQTPNNPPGPDGSSPNTFIDDMDDLYGHTYSPPRSAMPVNQDNFNRLGALLSEYTGWSQVIAITYRNPDDLAEITYPGGINVVTDLAMVQCSIYKGSELIYVTEWLIVRPQGGWGP